MRARRGASNSARGASGTFELDAATLAVREERVELDHGWIVEWLENRAEGIEQGWTITARPIRGALLWIGLDLGGDLALRIEKGARSGVLVDACGEACLRYTGLRAFKRPESITDDEAAQTQVGLPVSAA